MAGFCRSYVTWVYDETSEWATWEPGDRVNLGDIGYFDRSLKFTRADTSTNLLDTSPEAIDVQAVEGQLHYSSRYFSIASNASAGMPGVGAAAVTFSLKKGEGHVLQIGRGTCEGVQNEAAMLDAAKEAIVASDWGLAWILVCERKRVDSGFAANCRGRGASFTMSAGVEPVPLSKSMLGQVGLHIISSKGQVNHWGFGQGSTPTFDRSWRIRPEVVEKLYGEDPEWVSSDQLYYRPDRSSLTPDAVRAMKRRELFETGFTLSSVSRAR